MNLTDYTLLEYSSTNNACKCQMLSLINPLYTQGGIKTLNPGNKCRIILVYQAYLLPLFYFDMSSLKYKITILQRPYRHAFFRSRLLRIAQSIRALVKRFRVHWFNFQAETLTFLCSQPLPLESQNVYLYGTPIYYTLLFHIHNLQRVVLTFPAIGCEIIYLITLLYSHDFRALKMNVNLIINVEN